MKLIQSLDGLDHNHLMHLLVTENVQYFQQKLIRIAYLILSTFTISIRSTQTVGPLCV